ncbi:MAG: aryl-sulfate sulfotransferase [Saprospiraceae bacterium]
MIKLRFLFLLMLLMVNLSILNAQNTVGLLSIKGTQVSEGYNLFYPYSQSTVFLVDLCGEVVHQWIDFTGGRPAASAYLLPNGNLVRCSRDKDFSMDAFVAGGFGGNVDILSWENKMLYSYTLNDSLYRLHHDVAPMPNGHILMLAWEKITPLQAVSQGRDENTLPNDALWPDKILEWDPQSDSIVWEWRAWDHLIQDRDSLLPNYGIISEHPERLDVNYDTQGGNPDWMHTNYIDYNPVLDQIMISVRNFNEIWVIDHSTSLEEARGDSGGRSGKGGGILFRWGNPDAYKQGDETLHHLHFQHDAHWTDPDALPGQPLFGEVAVFDNFTEINKSTALLVKLDFDTASWTYPASDGVYGPEKPERIIVHPENSIFSFSGVGSSVQRLPNGNVLVFAGRWGYAYEVTENNELVWEYRIPMLNGTPVSQGDVLNFSENEAYNFVRYPDDYPAFNNRDLFSRGYLELNPDEAFCFSQTSSIHDRPVLQSPQFWPNPAQSEIRLQMDPSLQTKLSIYTMQGQTVRQWPQGTRYFPVLDLPNGVYLLVMDGFRPQKLVIQH